MFELRTLSEEVERRWTMDARTIRDDLLKPGAKVKLLTANKDIPKSAICVKEYPYFYLMRSEGNSVYPEGYTFPINKVSLRSQEGNIKVF